MRKLFLGFWLALLVATAFSPPARAIVIEAEKKQLSGYLIKETPDKLTIRTIGEDGVELEKEFERKAIKILHRIDTRRLEGLAPNNPQAYRNYAEELYEEKQDPEAQELAIRLFAIAAYLDPANQGTPCLKYLRDLPLSPGDRRKCVTLSYLLDPKKDASVFQRPAQPGSPGARLGGGGEGASSWTAFVNGLRQLRRGDTRGAARKLQQADVQKHFAAVPGIVPLADVLATAIKYPTCTESPRCVAGWNRCPACRGSGKTGIGGKVMPCPACSGAGHTQCKFCKDLFPGLAPEQLQILLSLELAEVEEGRASAPAMPSSPPLTKGGPGGVADLGPSGQRWSAIMKTSHAAPIRMPTLETVTPFNPRQCLHRNGQWLAP